MARSKRYFFPEDETYLRFGRSSWLRHAPAEELVGIVPWSHYALARLCRGIKTLDEHAASCLRTLGWQGSSQAPPGQPVAGSLLGAGGAGAPHTVGLEQMKQELDWRRSSGSPAISWKRVELRKRP